MSTRSLSGFSSGLALSAALVLLPVAKASSASLNHGRPALWAAAQVDSARIVATIRSLSADSTGAPASRYAERTATYDHFAPQIAESLGGAPLAVLWAFESDRTETTQFNVVRVIAGSAPSPGLVLLTAHYDATGRRTPGWDGLTDPAPGADDNASGVACLIESARIIESLALPFDVAVVAFGAEEAFGPPSSAPLEGSRALVRDLDNQGLPILAAINCDMIAFNPDRRKVDVVANASSRWIGDLFEATAAVCAPGLQVVRIPTETTLNSDHASFWGFAEDAVTLIENQFPDAANSLYPGNPNYHMVTDTAGYLNYGMAADITRAAVATIASLAEAPPGPPDLLVDSLHVVALPRRIFVGDNASVEVRVYNRGGVIASSAPATLELWLEEPAGARRLLGSQSIEMPIQPWFYKRAVFTWPVGEKDVGSARLLARVTASGLAEASVANNETRRVVSVLRNEVSNVRAITNPIRPGPSFDSFRFAFDVPLHPNVPQDVEATVYDINGRRVARHPREPARDGSNFLLWRNFDVEGDGDLPSGMYLVDVRLLDRTTGAEVSRAAGKFVFQH